MFRPRRLTNSGVVLHRDKIGCGTEGWDHLHAGTEFWEAARLGKNPLSLSVLRLSHATLLCHTICRYNVPFSRFAQTQHYPWYRNNHLLLCNTLAESLLHSSSSSKIVAAVVGGMREADPATWSLAVVCGTQCTRCDVSVWISSCMRLTAAVRFRRLDTKTAV